MFVLVHNNMVFAGPSDWDRNFFAAVAESRGIDLSSTPLPQTLERDAVIDIDANTKIVPAIFDTIPGFDPMFEYRMGPLFEIQDRQVVVTYQIVEHPIETIKANITSKLAEMRYVKETTGASTTIQNVSITLDTTREGRNIFLQKYSLMGDSDTVNWKFPETWLTLTKLELGMIVFAGVTHIQAAFDWEMQKTQELAALTSVEDLRTFYGTLTENS